MKQNFKNEFKLQFLYWPYAVATLDLMGSTMYLLIFEQEI